MEENDKIFIKQIGNMDNFNEIIIEKSEKFLDNWQDFIVDIGIAKIRKGEYVRDGKSYDMKTYYSLFPEILENDKNVPDKRFKIDHFTDGSIHRYFNKNIELLIIFFTDRISIVFYANQKNRKKIIDSLLKFCRIKKVR